MLEKIAVVGALLIVSVIFGGFMGWLWGVLQNRDQESRVDSLQLRDPADAVPQRPTLQIVRRRPDTVVVIRYE